MGASLLPRCEVGISMVGFSVLLPSVSRDAAMITVSLLSVAGN